jgi:hypothetical protein
VVNDLLFRTSAETLLQIARDPKHLGADIGFFSVLHSWNQKLELHPHIHCVVPAGGRSPDHTHWVASQKNFFLPVAVLGEVFRAKFTEALQEAFARNKLNFCGLLKPLGRPKAFGQLIRQTFRQKWVVYSKRPFGGPEQALRYLGCYTHRVAISNHRLVSFVNDQVTFRWRDSAHHNQKRLMALPVHEFLRRFLLHVLPPGFVRIRHFGFLSTRKRSTLLPLCLRLLGTTEIVPTAARTSAPRPAHQRVTWVCPHCQGPMLILERWTASQLRFRSPPSFHTTAAYVSTMIRYTPLECWTYFCALTRRVLSACSTPFDLNLVPSTNRFPPTAPPFSRRMTKPRGAPVL